MPVERPIVGTFQRNKGGKFYSELSHCNHQIRYAEPSTSESSFQLFSPNGKVVHLQVCAVISNNYRDTFKQYNVYFLKLRTFNVVTYVNEEDDEPNRTNFTTV